MILWSVLYLEEVWWLSVLEGRPMMSQINWISNLFRYIGWCFLRLGYWSKGRRYFLRLGFQLRRRGCYLDRGHWMRWRGWYCLLTLWLGLGAFQTLSLDWSLTGLGGIGTWCLGTLEPCRFAGLLLQQPKFHELKYRRVLVEFLLKNKSYRRSSRCSRCTLKI